MALPTIAPKSNSDLSDYEGAPWPELTRDPLALEGPITIPLGAKPHIEAAPMDRPVKSVGAPKVDRRQRPRLGDRRILAVAAPKASNSAAGLAFWQHYAQDHLKAEVAMWFEDLRWGTPLARKLLAVALAIGFLAFCTFVVLATLGDQAAL